MDDYEAYLLTQFKEKTFSPKDIIYFIENCQGCGNTIYSDYESCPIHKECTFYHSNL